MGDGKGKEYDGNQNKTNGLFMINSLKCIANDPRWFFHLFVVAQITGIRWNSSHKKQMQHPQQIMKF